MARVSPNNIQSRDEDWGYDENTGLPFSGRAVQAFIKSFLRYVAKAAWFDNTTNTLYFFETEEDRDTFKNDTTQTTLPTIVCPMNFSSVMYRVDITNYNGATNLYVATNSGSLVLSTSFVVQSRSLSDQNWTNLQNGCHVTIYIDRGLTGNYVALTERTLYQSGADISIDVFGQLANGTNRVKFMFEDEEGNVTTSLVYTITLAELYVELFNNFWYQPILGSDATTWRLGGFRIAGAGYKTLHMSLYNSLGTKVVDDLTAAIGTGNTYANQMPYYYNFAQDSPIHSLPTGVYKVVVYVSTGTVSSESIEYNIMYIAASDTATARIICLNEVADKAYNYATADLCQYSVYDGGATFANLVATFTRKHGNTTVDTTTAPLANVTTGEIHTLTYEVLWPEIVGNGYSLAFLLEMGAAQASAVVPIDNSKVFPPTDEYDFYVLSSNRNNSETTREKFINLADNSQLTPSWTAVDFTNGMDGWTVDNNGRTCLRIPAGSRVTLPSSAFRLMLGDNEQMGFSLELCYKVANVADYDEDVITIGTGHGMAGFAGIRVKPTNVTVHTKADTTAANDSKQGTNLCDEEPVHLLLTVNPRYRGVNRLAYCYVNGCKKFPFAYVSDNDWRIDGGITIGSNKSDVFLYFVRRYPFALSDWAAQVNFINSLTTIDERERIYALLTSVLSSQSELDFETVKNNDYNFFVVTMEQGHGVPSAANGWEKDTTGVSTLEMHFGKNPAWDWKMEHLETSGQGTTSMNYFLWNIRWRIDKSRSDTPQKKTVPVRYLASRTKSGGKYLYEWGEAADSSTLFFDGGANGSTQNHPALMRITAKINSASSMQSHKMGATWAYTELANAIGLENEAQAYARENNLPKPTVSVYQYPAFGFEYDPISDTYTFIGLFTIGPDKGDKPTFGYNLSAVKNTLISMEGTDHNQQLATFTYPYDEGVGLGMVNYFYTKEGLGIDKGDGTYNIGLEIGNCHGKEIDKTKGATDESDVRTIIHDEFKPAYDLVWHNSTLIFPVALNDATYHGANAAAVLANINANVATFQATQYAADPRFTYGDMQFWIEGEHRLYWYNPITAQYVAGDLLGSPTGATLDEQNENYKAARRASFMALAEDWWDITDALFHLVFCIIFGATDNFAKNSYPYKMALQANGGRWKWRQDDLDTIFDIDNMGQGTKPYHIEFEDANNGTPFFAGGRSVFWNLIFQCYWENYISTTTGVSAPGARTVGQNMIAAMARLSGENNPYDGFVGYISKCFWEKAQEYFPASAYNADAVIKYEEAWLAGRTEALPQCLGNHYEAERLWVQRRAVYMLSLFRTGPFGSYSDTRLGRINFRPLALAYSPVPVIWMYPALLTGAGGTVSGGRTQPGFACALNYTGTFGETEFYFQATNFMSTFGNMKGLRLAAGYINEIGIYGAKLTEFIIGDAVASNVTTNVPGLKFNNTYCLELIDARNAISITSVTGLENCIRLRTLLLAGSGVTSVEIPSGARLETLSLPAAIQKLALRSLKRLSSLSSQGYQNVTDIILEDLMQLDAFGLLRQVYNAAESLARVRVVWTGVYSDTTGDSISMLAELAHSNCHGLAADGQTVTDKPFIEGTLDVSTVEFSPEEFYESLTITDDEPYGDGLKRARIADFGTSLFVIYNPAAVYYEEYLATEDDYFLTTEDDYFILLSD